MSQDTWLGLAAFLVALASFAAALAALKMASTANRLALESRELTVKFSVVHRWVTQGAVVFLVAMQMGKMPVYIHEVYPDVINGEDEEDSIEVGAFGPMLLGAGSARVLHVRVRQPVEAFQLIAACSVDEHGDTRHEFSEVIIVHPDSGTGSAD